MISKRGYLVSFAKSGAIVEIFSEKVRESGGIMSGGEIKGKFLDRGGGKVVL
jgi:hypothetical protein